MQDLLRLRCHETSINKSLECLFSNFVWGIRVEKLPDKQISSFFFCLDKRQSSMLYIYVKESIERTRNEFSRCDGALFDWLETTKEGVPPNF